MQNVKKENILDFVIVGAAKSGTSSLSYYLGEHPDVFLPKPQLHFHSRIDKTDNSWGQYAEHFRAATPGQKVGEHSPFYYTHEEAASSLSASCPGLKLIWLLRHPIDRAWSHYWYNVMGGSEHVSPQDIIHHERWQKIYIRKSVYSTFLETYLSYFNGQNMMFVFTEKLRESPDDVLMHICRFIDVDDSFSFKRSGEMKRRTVRPGNVALHQRLGRIRATKLVSIPGVPRILQRINHWNLSCELPYPEIPQAEKKKLEEYFQPFNLRLSKLIDIDVNEIWHNNV